MRIDESISKTCFSCFPMLTCKAQAQCDYIAPRDIREHALVTATLYDHSMDEPLG